MTTDEMIVRVEQCQALLAEVEAELSHMLERSDIAIKSSLFGADP